MADNDRIAISAKAIKFFELTMSIPPSFKSMKKEDKIEH